MGTRGSRSVTPPARLYARLRAARPLAAPWDAKTGERRLSKRPPTSPTTEETDRA